MTALDQREVNDVRFQTIRERCAIDYRENFRLRDACERNQVKALQQLGDDLPVNRPLQQQIRSACALRYPDRFSLQVACAENYVREIALGRAFGDVGAVPESGENRPGKDPSVGVAEDMERERLQRARTLCEQQWGNLQSMVDHCEQQARQKKP